MKNRFECTVIKKGLELRISIPEITKEEVSRYKLLGSAIGIDLGHCFYMGARYHKDFLTEVKAYRINNDPDKELDKIMKGQPSSMKVDFYGLEGR